MVPEVLSPQLCDPVFFGGGLVVAYDKSMSGGLFLFDGQEAERG